MYAIKRQHKGKFTQLHKVRFKRKTFPGRVNLPWRKSKTKHSRVEVYTGLFLYMTSNLSYGF